MHCLVQMELSINLYSAYVCVVSAFLFAFLALMFDFWVPEERPLFPAYPFPWHMHCYSSLMPLRCHSSSSATLHHHRWVSTSPAALWAAVWLRWGVLSPCALRHRLSHCTFVPHHCSFQKRYFRVNRPVVSTLLFMKNECEDNLPVWSPPGCIPGMGTLVSLHGQGCAAMKYDIQTIL